MNRLSRAFISWVITEQSANFHVVNTIKDRASDDQVCLIDWMFLTVYIMFRMLTYLATILKFWRTLAVILQMNKQQVPFIYL